MADCGVEYSDSFNFNPHKWFLTNSDCSAMWFKNTKDAEAAFKVKASIPSGSVFEPEIQHWQIPNVRRFRALKLWFVMRIYGVEGIQKHIRHHVGLAKYLEKLVRNDERFELLVSTLGVVCFRLKGEDSRTQVLLDKIAERKNLFLMPYYCQGRLVIRFVICSSRTEYEDIDYAWKEIISLLENQNLINDVARDKIEVTSSSNLLNKVASTPITLEDRFKLGLFL